MSHEIDHDTDDNNEALPAYSLPEKVLLQPKYRHFRDTWFIVPCPHCRRVHQHGSGEGERGSHCPPDNDYHHHEFEGRERPNQYVLKYAGPAPKEIVAAILRPKRPSRPKTPKLSAGFRPGSGPRKAPAR